MKGHEVRELLIRHSAALDILSRKFQDAIGGIDRKKLSPAVNDSLTMYSIYLGNIGELLDKMDDLESERTAWEDV